MIKIKIKQNSSVKTTIKSTLSDALDYIKYDLMVDELPDFINGKPEIIGEYEVTIDDASVIHYEALRNGNGNIF